MAAVRGLGPLNDDPRIALYELRQADLWEQGGAEFRAECDLRHGITSLFAAFNIADGTVISELHRRHRAIEFRKFLASIDKAVPAGLDVHWGAPRFPDCGSFRIFTGKDGIRCQGNTGSSHPSFARKRRGW